LFIIVPNKVALKLEAEMDVHVPVKYMRSPADQGYACDRRGSLPLIMGLSMQKGKVMIASVNQERTALDHTEIENLDTSENTHFSPTATPQKQYYRHKNAMRADCSARTTFLLFSVHAWHGQAF